MAEMTYEETQSELQSGGHAPACMFANPDNGLGAELYAAYNAAGPMEKRGLNYRGEPCPQWHQLPQAVQEKWNAVAHEAMRLAADAVVSSVLVQDAMRRAVMDRRTPE